VSPAWNYENAAHLLRRVGFGGTPVEIGELFGRHPTVESAVNELLSFVPSKEKPPSPKANDEPGMRKIQGWWLKEMITASSSNKACMEKLALFWHGHLVSGASKQPNLGFMSVQNGLFRFNARGNFKTLIREFTRDPANLYYLDGIANVASSDGVNVSANENYARELLELFIYGRFQVAPDGSPDPSRPNYTESDVHQLGARTVDDGGDVPLAADPTGGAFAEVGSGDSGHGNGGHFGNSSVIVGHLGNAGRRRPRRSRCLPLARSVRWSDTLAEGLGKSNLSAHVLLTR
jgi:hypothetical protein